MQIDVNFDVVLQKYVKLRQNIKFRRRFTLTKPRQNLARARSAISLPPNKIFNFRKICCRSVLNSKFIYGGLIIILDYQHPVNTHI